MTMDKKQMDLFKAETTWFHVFAPLKEREQAARRPDRTPPDDRPRPTEERAVLVRLPSVTR